MAPELSSRQTAGRRLLRWFTAGSALWLAGCCLVVTVAILSETSPIPGLLLLYAGVTAAMSALAFCCYWFDKRRAIQQGQRISERKLHLLALCGGWPGATLGQQLFRHKTQKLKFRLVYWVIVLLHLALVAGCAWLMIRPAAPTVAMG